MEEGFAYIGNRHEWGGEHPFGLFSADRRQHLYTIGKTGTGKTTLLRNLIVQDIEAGRGVAVIDPHGDLAEELLNFIPPWRTPHVVYFNPADTEYPISFNVLDTSRPIHLVASGIVSAFKSVWRDSWGPRLEYILYATVAALLESEHTSLLGVQRMLSDAKYRAWVVKQVKDPMVRSFWLHEFANYEAKFVQEAIAPIQNKLGQLFMSPLLRNILGQVRSKMDLRFMMDSERILIANLAKGRLGEDKSNLLGSLLIAQFQVAAMSRVDTSEPERCDFFLYADEAHNFITDSFTGILSEARKYRLCLTLSHQYVDQFRPEIRQAVFGNVGSIIAFRIGQTDAEVLEREFGRAYSVSQFASLGTSEICCKLLQEGVPQAPFRGVTFPAYGSPNGRRDTVVRQSRQRYSERREVVEEKIKRWLQ